MTCPFHTPGDDESHGRTSIAFRCATAILAAAAVLLFCMVRTEMGLGSAVVWIAALLAGAAAFRLAPVLIALIMIVTAPVLIIAVLIRFLL